MKNLPLLFLAIIVSTTIFAQNVNIPDANFKAALVGNSSINTNMDTEIQTSEATAFTGTMNVSNLSISDLTGIEAFTALTYLNCRSNQLTSLDVSQNNNVNLLVCSYNQLSTLILSQNTVYYAVHCDYNLLTNLIISSPIHSLDCSNNQLTCLNVLDNSLLTADSLYTTNNSSLSCIQVSNTSVNYTYIDSWTSTSTNCNNACSSVGIKEQDLLSNINLSPNPTKSTFVLGVTSSRNAVLNMSLTNSLGQVVLSKQSNLNIGLNEINFDIQNQPSGIYFMSINYENNHFTKKIMKQ